MAEMMGKVQWRKRCKETRAAVPAEERLRMDSRIADRVLSLPEYAQANTLFAYKAFGSEVETRGIIEHAWKDGKAVLLPRCVPGVREMAWYRIDSLDGLVTSSFGVDEPAHDPEHEIDPHMISHGLALVPGLMFDPQGCRLGYGGGYYDVFLSRVDPVRITAVGLCRNCQLCSRVEVVEPHDRRVQMVVTESALYRV